MPPKTIFVRDEDAELYERFDAIAVAAHASICRMSQSRLIALAIRSYLDQWGDQGDLYVAAPDEDPDALTDERHVLHQLDGWKLRIQSGLYVGLMNGHDRELLDAVDLFDVTEATRTARMILKRCRRELLRRERDRGKRPPPVTDCTLRDGCDSPDT